MVHSLHEQCHTVCWRRGGLSTLLFSESRCNRHIQRRDTYPNYAAYGPQKSSKGCECVECSLRTNNGNWVQSGHDKHR